MSASSTAISKTTALEDIPTPDNVAPLFQPVTVGQFDLKVRAVYAPLTRCRAIGAIPHPSAAKYYSDRTSAGQLIISEATGVTESVTGYGYPNTPGLYSKEQIEAWKPIVKAVHDKEGVFFAQIWHTGRASHPAYEFGKQPVSSSAIAISDGQVFHPETFETFPYPEPRALETDEIPQYVDWFRQGARNAIEAGFDGVEIHATNGYLINQFLDDGVNKRTDKYGGSIENRCRFCLEIVEAVTKEIGSDRVGIRLGAFHAFNDCADSDPYNLYSYLIEKLNDYNLAYMHIIDAKVQGNEDRATVSDSIEPFVKLCKTKVIVAGGVIDRDGKNSGPEQIASGKADLVCYGRWALANPDMLKRFKLGAPLNKYDRSTFYMPDPVKGYNDYPCLEDTEYGKEYFSDA